MSEEKFYLVRVDNTSGVLSDIFGWLGDSGEREFVGSSMRIVTADEYDAMHIDRWADGNVVRVRAMSAAVVSMAQTEAVLRVCTALGAHETVGSCEIDLVSCVASACRDGAFDLLAALREHRRANAEAAKAIQNKSTPALAPHNVSDDTCAAARATTLMDDMFADEKPPVQCPQLARYSRPLAPFLSVLDPFAN